jgi:ABC-type nitrate/sulfonate/bicarbonate transport system ATPase subunit
MIEIRGLTFGYAGQGKPVFQGLDWRVGRGETWAIIGPSGCGKSTLLYLIAGLRAPDEGRITVNGEPVPRKQDRGRTGLVLQDYGLLPWRTVRENADLGLQIRRFYRQDDREPIHSVEYWLERLGIGELTDKYPIQLSGGQRQRTAIARTLAVDPDVLLLDEPFSALDALTREDMQALMLDIQMETGLTMLLVTHNIEEAVVLGRRILVLNAPPNRQLRVIENAAAGGREFRKAPDFFLKTAELREALAHP